MGMNGNKTGEASIKQNDKKGGNWDLDCMVKL